MISPLVVRFNSSVACDLIDREQFDTLFSTLEKHHMPDGFSDVDFSYVTLDGKLIGMRYLGARKLAFIFDDDDIENESQEGAEGNRRDRRKLLFLKLEAEKDDYVYINRQPFFKRVKMSVIYKFSEGAKERLIASRVLVDDAFDFLLKTVRNHPSVEIIS